MTAIVIIILIIIGVIAISNSSKENLTKGSSSNNSDSYRINVSFPHPEKTNDFRFYKFIETTSTVILEPLLPEIKKQGMILKPEFEKAMKTKIETGEFKNPFTFKEYYGDKFDVIGIHFLKGTKSSTSAFQIGLCYIKDEKIADIETYDFSPPENIIETKAFQKTLEINDILLEDIELFNFNFIWDSYDLKTHLNKNLIALWEEESEILKKVLKHNNITDFSIKYISIKEIAEKNKLPTQINSLLSHFKSEISIDDELGEIYAGLATDLIEKGISLEKYIHHLNPSSTKSKKTNIKSIAKKSSLTDFIAIDVETAIGKRWSICQIGLTFVENGEIKKTISDLIQPPNNEYSKWNTKVHGITPKKTKGKPSFPVIWEKIYPLIQNKKLVAHNADFDINCLNQTLDYYNLEKPIFNYDCTFKKTGQKLDLACVSYNIDLDNHHDAGCDAEACAKLYLKMLDGTEPDYNVKPKTIKTKSNLNFEGHERLSGYVLKPDLESADNKSPFYNKKVVFTGVLETIDRQDAAMKVQKMGADINTSISKLTNFVIIGSNPGPSKMNKIIKYKNEGAGIEIIYEKEFIKIINNWR